MSIEDSSNSNRNKLKKTSVIIVDVYPLMRQALRMGIEKQHDFEVIAEACDEKETVDLVSKLHPGIVLMSVDLPSSSGIECTKEIKKIFKDTKVLVLTPIGSHFDVLDIMEAGASGYVNKKEPLEGIIHALRQIIAEETTFYEPLFDSAPRVDMLKDGTTVRRTKSDRLTERELTILRYLARGMSNKEIASILGVSLPSVKVRVSNILMKLHVSSRTEAVSSVLKYGILTLDDLRQ